MRIYFGRVAYGWVMYGIGYKTEWFFGFSKKYEFDKDIDKTLEEN